MDRVADLPGTHHRRYSAGAAVSDVSVLRWPADRTGGVFEMFSAREAGWFGSLDADASDPASGENVLLVSASRRADPDAPAVVLSFVNTSPGQAVKLSVKLAGPTPKSIAGTVLTAPHLDTTGEPTRRPSCASLDPRPAPFDGAVLKGKVVEVTVPARSVVVLTCRSTD